jgi:hypothetical protein
VVPGIPGRRSSMEGTSVDNRTDSTSRSEEGICPFATPKLLPLGVNHQEGGIVPRVAVWHIMQGSLDGTYEWFLNPESQVSSHFGIGEDGELWQFVRVIDMAWHCAEGNPYAIGVENEGWSGNPLTDAQIKMGAKLFDWLHDTIPAIAYWRNLRPFTGRGLSWHGLGGQDWGNHPECPGAPVVAQLDTILRIGEDHP